MFLCTPQPGACSLLGLLTPLLRAGSTLGLPLVGATSWSTPLMRAGSISEASNGKLLWFRDGFRPNCYLESTELGPPAGRRVRFGSFLEGRFTARMHYCTSSSPCLRRMQISKEASCFPVFSMAARATFDAEDQGS